MSDFSPQLSSQLALLLAPGQGGQPGAAGLLRAPGLLSGQAVGKPAPTAQSAAQGASKTLAGVDFAQALQALLNRVESAEALTAEALPAGGPSPVPLDTALARLQGGEAARAAIPGQTLTLSEGGGGKPLPPSGSSLPPGGSILPPAAPLLADSPAPELPPAAAEQALRARGGAGELVEGSNGASEARLRSAADELVSRILNGDNPSRPAAELTPAAERSTDARALNAAAVTPPLPDAIRQGIGLSEGRLRTGLETRTIATSDAETFKGALGDLLAARADAAKLTPVSDTATAQFNLNARPADGSLMMPQPASADSVLRDLQSMMPLRPQTGEANQAFAQGLGQRLVMMAENGIESARLRLSPANLGQLDIQISIEDDRAQVTFGTQHSSARDALESALPRLRELFAAQGLELTQADVEDRSGNNPADDAPGQNSAAAPAAASNAADAPVGAGPDARLWVDGSRGLDIYV